MFGLHVYVHYVHAWCHRGQKRALDTLELELLMAMARFVNAGNQIRILL